MLANLTYLFKRRKTKQKASIKNISIPLANLFYMKYASKLLLILSSVPTLLLAQQSQTDSTQLQEVHIQGNRLQIPVNQSSRNIQIISQKEIQSLPSTSINEVLRYAAGVDIRQRGPFGTQADVGIDGGSFDQTILLVNGIKFSDPQTGHHMLNIPVPLEAIERIEILRGPASRIFGINGLTGAINIVTKKADSHSIFAHTYAGSSFENREEEGKKGIYWGKGIQLGGTISTEKQQHQLYLTKENSNGQRYNTASDNEKIFYQNQFQFNDRNALQMMAGYINNEFGANGYYAAPGDKESEEHVETVHYSLASTHQLGNKWFISPRFSHRYNEDDYRYYRNDLSKGRSKHYTHTLSGELNASYKSAYGDLGLGLETRQEKISSSNIGKHERVNFGAYTEFRTSHIKNFLINLGAYVNYNSDYDWQVFPGIDVSYLIGNYWQIAASTGSSQRIPTFTDLYLNQRPANIGNPELVSENAWQHDLTLKFNKDRIAAKAGYFYRDIDNFIDWTRESTAVPYQAMNLGKNQVHGVLVNFSFLQPFGGDQSLRFQVDYNYLDPSIINKTENKILKYGIKSLKHQLVGTLSYEVKEWSFTTANRYLERISGTPYFVSDFRVGYQRNNFRVYGDVQNIFDEEYLEIEAVPLLGRWVTLGVQYNLKFR